MSGQPSTATSQGPLSLECLSFNGTNSEDVTEFLRQIKRIAMAQGRQRNQDWMFDCAESCLGGSALRWFDQRQGEGEALASWDALRSALLSRFELPSDKDLPHAASPAALPPRLPSNGPRNWQPAMQKPKGRIKMLDRKGTLVGYCRVAPVTPPRKPHSVVCDTTVAAEASIFEYELPSKGIQLAHLKLMNFDNIFLNPVFLRIDPSSGWWELLLSTDCSSGSRNVWTLTGNTITLSFQNHRMSTPTKLGLECTKQSNQLIVYEVGKGKEGQWGYTPLRMIFEPV
ncbi:hypothetical protein FRB93_008438 [Tulasnella sp. JGI-2019a]|nr:hypothetical protein FRB93_008438 [Tulasnella sp. JGI-2019a]